MKRTPPTTWFPVKAAFSTPDRRLFLRSTVTVGTVALTVGTGQAQEARKALLDYKPVFFVAAEWRFVLAACARLIPSDGEGPGAIETHVPIFIDRQLNGEFGAGADWYMQGPHVPDADPALGYQSPLGPAAIYRGAISKVDGWCVAQKGKAFAELDAKVQDEILEAVSAGKIGLEPELRDFFRLLLQNTKEGYFADPLYGGNHQMLSWRYIGYPGARGSFLEWVDRHNVPYPLGPVSINGERA